MTTQLRRLFAATTIAVLGLGALNGCVFLPALAGSSPEENPTNPSSPAAEPIDPAEESDPASTDVLPESTFTTSQEFISAFESRLRPCSAVEHYSADEQAQQAGQNPVPALEGATLSSCAISQSDYFIVIILGPGKDVLTEVQQDQTILSQVTNSPDFMQSKFGTNWMLGATPGVDLDAIASEMGGFDIDIE